MIDILSEDLIRLEDAKKILPGRPDRATIYRWALGKGTHGVRLESVKCGGRARFTSKQACQRFVEAVTAAADKREAPPAVRTSRQRQQDAAAAAKRLKAAGILN